MEDTTEKDFTQPADSQGETNDDGNTYRHVLKYTSLFGGVQGLNMLIGVVRNKLVALILGPNGMGLAALFNSTVNFVSQTTNLGVSFSAVRNISEAFGSGDDAKIRHAISVIRAWTTATAILGTLVCALFGSALSDYTFTWGDHTLHFIMLAPAVGFTAIAGGEGAILKGTRRLRQFATAQVLTIVASLLVSVPLYLAYGQTAVVPVIVLVLFASMLFTILYSYKFYPPIINKSVLKGAMAVLRSPFRKRGVLLREGMPMIRLGIAFAVGGMLGSGAEFIIRSWLNRCANLDVVGFYNAGYTMAMVYGGVVFTAMETDFFPRLSAVNSIQRECDAVINKQIEAALLIISPLLVAFSVSLPVLVPLLFSSKFVPVIAMLQVAIIALYFRTLKLPVAYLTLAKGDSRNYLILEAYSDVLMVAGVVVGYQTLGIPGLGMGLLLTEIADVIVLNIYARVHYHYTSSRRIWIFAAAQLPIAIATYLCVTTLSGITYWGAGFALFALSLILSLVNLRKN